MLFGNGHVPTRTCESGDSFMISLLLVEPPNPVTCQTDTVFSLIQETPLSCQGTLGILTLRASQLGFLFGEIYDDS